ncbi:DNA recombination protein RmuC [Tenacibaculum salmonis]|uniref:DNA recombination protein RmuC n=1 Tax=Tenacibaculum sp. P3-BQ1 TaxID=3232310 RepID=UPI0034DFC7EA
MNTSILIASSTLLFGFIIGNLLSKLKAKQLTTDLEKELTGLKINVSNLETHKEDIQNHLNEALKEKEIVSTQLVIKKEELKNFQLKFNENKEEVTKLQDKFTKEFENLANKILEEKSTKFTAQNKENIDNILNPLHEKIKTFEDKVDKTHKESIDYHAALRQQIVGLREMNLQMSKETINLTKALKGDNKIQGNWGELVLERVLEKSGLEKGSEYFVQQSFINDEGKRVLPDVVIHLPNNKKMIIDSKVSLKAYEEFVNTEDDDIRKEQFLKQHINSLSRHVEQLSEKKYEDIYKVESPDFVLLFIPIEPAFAIALNQDNSLYNKAFEKNIVIVTPTTLLATLRTIDTMWNNEKQQQYALEIARQAGALYDKFYGLLQDLIGIGKKIDAAKGDYNSAMNKLVDGTGNLINRIEKIKKMGVKTKKSLPDSILNRAQAKI